METAKQEVDGKAESREHGRGDRPLVLASEEKAENDSKERLTPGQMDGVTKECVGGAERSVARPMNAP